MGGFFFGWHKRHHRPHWRKHAMRWGMRHAMGRGPFWAGAPDDEGTWPFGGGWPFGGKGDGGGGGRRRKRGDIKYALLELIAERPRHGYELIKELETRHGGFQRPSPGSVYPTLQMLEEAGFLVSEEVEGKRVYSITDAGRQLLAERDAVPHHEGGRGGRRGWGAPPAELHALRHSAMGLMGAVMQVVHQSTPAQVTAITGVLDRARQEVLSILAGNGPEGQKPQ